MITVQTFGAISLPPSDGAFPESEGIYQGFRNPCPLEPDVGP